MADILVDIPGYTNNSQYHPGYDPINPYHGYNTSTPETGYTSGYEYQTGSTISHDVNPTQMDETGGDAGGGLYQFPPAFVAILSILYGIISFAAVAGNALVILVVAKNRSMQTVTNFFFANLSFADVMIGIFSIPFQFQAALLQRWDPPAFLCPVAPFVKEMTVNVSILTLTVIAVDRYRVVV